MKNRRKFLEYAAFGLMSMVALNAKTTNVINAQVSIKGALDDDLFVIKSTAGNNEMKHCYQMHNPKKYFNYHGKAIESNNIYGDIDFNRSISIENENEVLSIFLANEREEINDLPRLFMRSHFKAVDLKCNDKILIPELIPEHNSVPGYPVWFGNDEGYCFVDEKDARTYNYYKMWENAICGGGFIFNKECNVEFKMFAKNNKLISTVNQKVTIEPKNLISSEVKSKKFSSHILTETNGKVFDNKKNKKEDEIIKNTSIDKIIITFNKTVIELDLPYPLPYINRLYAVALNEK